jgi:putative sterol carrier protein
MDLSQVSPEEFASMVSQSSDEDIKAAIQSVGADKVLDRIFSGMEERFVPDRAQGVDAEIQWVVTEDGTEHPYVTVIRDGSCKITQATTDNPKVALTLDTVTFSKLVTGQAQGPQLFMAGKLKVTGDVMFSARITNFFDTPKV